MFTVKIMTGSENVGDADTRKEYRLYAGVKFVDFQRRADDGRGSAYMVYADGEHETHDVPGNVYVMNEQGKTVSQFAAAPIPNMTLKSIADKLRGDESPRHELRADKWKARFMNLAERVSDLYFAAYWKPDRNISEDDQSMLWAGVRDCANIKSGQTYEKLGPPQWVDLNGSFTRECDIAVAVKPPLLIEPAPFDFEKWYEQHWAVVHGANVDVQSTQYHAHKNMVIDRVTAMNHMTWFHSGSIAKAQGVSDDIADQTGWEVPGLATVVNEHCMKYHEGDPDAYPEHCLLCGSAIAARDLPPADWRIEHEIAYHPVQPPVGASEVLSESTVAPVNAVSDEPFNYETWEANHTADGHVHSTYSHRELVTETEEGAKRHEETFMHRSPPAPKIGGHLDF